MNHSKGLKASKLPADAEKQIDPEPTSAVVLLFRLPRRWSFGATGMPSGVLSYLTDWKPGFPPQMVTANALFYDWQFSAVLAKNTSFRRVVIKYREFFILVDALFRRVDQYRTAPYIFVG